MVCRRCHGIYVVSTWLVLLTIARLSAQLVIMQQAKVMALELLQNILCGTPPAIAYDNENDRTNFLATAQWTESFSLTGANPSLTRQALLLHNCAIIGAGARTRQTCSLSSRNLALHCKFLHATIVATHDSAYIHTSHSLDAHIYPAPPYWSVHVSMTAVMYKLCSPPQYCLAFA